MTRSAERQPVECPLCRLTIHYVGGVPMKPEVGDGEVSMVECRRHDCPIGRIPR
jgi:hypothetical protein